MYLNRTESKKERNKSILSNVFIQTVNEGLNVKVLVRKQEEKGWISLPSEGYSGEVHLQEILFRDPDIVPVEDISSDTELSPIKLMLKEVGLPGSGATDLVGIDKNGNIYIIETKLARNPEVRRQVIGQILEYAAFLNEKGLDWLDDVVKKQKNVSISEYFDKLNDPDWDKESFEQNLRDNLDSGTFKLFIAVDEMNPDLQRIINYMENVLSMEIYALELRYFKDKDGMEILVPNVHGGKKKPPKPLPTWDWDRFVEDAKKKVDAATLATLQKLYEFSLQLGKVDFGKGRTYGTFRVWLPYKNDEINLYVITSTGKGNWFGFKSMVGKQVDKGLISEYVKQLKSLGFKLDEKKHVEAYPTFETAILNQEEKFSEFKKYTNELKEKLLSRS
jgi:hypothetical protein